MDRKLHKIYELFDGKLVGDFPITRYVCEVVAEMPEELIKLITSKCWFLSSIEDASAYTFKGNDLKDQYLILMSDHLLKQNKNNIKYTIAHEIGHVVLDHRNSINYKQTMDEINWQEKEADEFAKRFIKESSRSYKS